MRTLLAVFLVSVLSIAAYTVILAYVAANLHR